jgi:hypothetical protein
VKCAQDRLRQDVSLEATERRWKKHRQQAHTLDYWVETAAMKRDMCEATSNIYRYCTLTQSERASPKWDSAQGPNTIKHGVQITDIAPTIAHHFGLIAPPEWIGQPIQFN